MKNYFATILATAVAIAGIATFHSTQKAHAAERAWIPLTEHVVTKKFDEHGTLASAVTSLEAVRTDGSHVRSTEWIDGQPGHIRVITDLASGKRTTVDLFTKSITTYYLTPTDVRRLQIGKACVTKPDAEWKRALGFDIFHRTETVAMGPDTDRHDDWVSPALKCRPLAGTTYFGNGTHNEMQVASLTVGEPDASLFQIPTDYVERSPSEVFQEAARLRGGECVDCASRHRIQDQAYAGRQH